MTMFEKFIYNIIRSTGLVILSIYLFPVLTYRNCVWVLPDKLVWDHGIAIERTRDRFQVNSIILRDPTQ